MQPPDTPTVGEQSGLVTLTFDLESGVRVTCDVGYLCANFGLPRPLCSQLRPDVRIRQTDVRQRHRLIPRLGGGGITKLKNSDERGGRQHSLQYALPSLRETRVCKLLCSLSMIKRG